MTSQTPQSIAVEPDSPLAGSLRTMIISVALLLMLAALDQTIVSTALPTIVADLGGLEHLSWVVTAYILASTVSAPLYGKLGDLYGRRNMIFISVGLFLLGSALCGAAGSMAWLIASRALQGLGGGGLFVLAISVVGDVVPPRERGKVQGVFAAVFSMASVVGPMIGGWFVEAVSWHWIFYINLPVGALALIGFSYSFKPTGNRTKHKIDWSGAAVLTIGLGAVTLVTSLGGQTFEWASAWTWALGALAVGALALFAVIEMRSDEPIIPLSLFKLNVFSVTSGVNFVAGAAMFGSVTFLPIYLQIANGVSPTVSGLQLLPMTLGILISSNVCGRYMGRTGHYRWLPAMGTASITIGMLLLTRLSADTPWQVFSIYIAFIGLGMGCIFPVATTAVQSAAPREQLGTASAANMMFRQIGGSIGVAVFGAIFTAQMASLMGGAADSLSMGGEISPMAMTQLPPEMRAQVSGLVVEAILPIFWVASAVAALGVILALFLKEVPLRSRIEPAE